MVGQGMQALVIFQSPHSITEWIAELHNLLYFSDLASQYQMAAIRDSLQEGETEDIPVPNMNAQPPRIQ